MDTYSRIFITWSVECNAAHVYSVQAKKLTGTRSIKKV